MKRTLIVPTMVAMLSLCCWSAAARAAEPAHHEKPRVSYLLTKVRVLPKAGAAAVLAGARITGSNQGPTFGFVPLAKIVRAPAAGQWLEIPVSTPTVYRYLKIEAAPDTLLAVAEIEFYSATGKLDGEPFGTATSSANHAYNKAFDGDPATAFEGAHPGAYVGLCLNGACQTAAPGFEPSAGIYARAVKVSLSVWPPDPARTIRYTTDESSPSRTHGEVYSKPIEIAANTSVAAIAFEDDRAESRVAVVSYLIGGGQKLGKQIKSYHIGNSLTDMTKGVLDVVSSSGGKNLVTYYKTICGCDIQFNWERPGQGFSYPPNVAGCPDGWSTRYEEVLAAKVDHLFLQPYPNWGGLAHDTKYGGNFIKLARRHNPDVQAWLYAQWNCYPGIDRAGKVVAAYCQPQGGPGGDGRKDAPETEVWMPPIPRGKVKTWDDTMQNATNYYRTVLEHWNEIPGGKKPVRLCPAGSALVRLEKEIAAGKMPGVSDFGDFTFSDDIHLSCAGRLSGDPGTLCVHFRRVAGRESDLGHQRSDESASPGTPAHRVGNGGQ